MYVFLTVVAFIVIFSVLVLIHECGHFFMARRSGVRVDEFGFGLPPRLFGKRIGETLYSINLFPFGGFVRLFGENPQEGGALSNTRSYSAQSTRVRIGIVIAGVAMNLLLAIVLLFGGFVAGMQPLLIEPSDVLQALDNGTLQVQSGYVVKSVTADTPAARAGFAAEDIVTAVDGKPLAAVPDIKAFFAHVGDPGSAGAGSPNAKRVFSIRRGDQGLSLTYFPGQMPSSQFGLTFRDSFMLPRVVIHEIKPDSIAAHIGMKAGDVILSVNKTPIYNLQDYEQLFLSLRSFTVRYLRDYKEYEASVNVPDRRSVIVSSVVPGSPAEKAGFMSGDAFVQINRQDVNGVADVPRLIASVPAKEPVQFLLVREGKLQTLYADRDADGKTGIFVAPLVTNDGSITVFETYLPVSVIELKRVSYPVFESFKRAISESWRLAGATLSMFGATLRQLVTSFSVPDGVSGPVGIAQMTGVFVREGLSSVVRFAALLSLSLGILNLLPFPGLDGGRLLFLVVESIRGRRSDERVEHVIHFVGFVILIVLILAVTYKDIVRLVAS